MLNALYLLTGVDIRSTPPIRLAWITASCHSSAFDSMFTIAVFIVSILCTISFENFLAPAGSLAVPFSNANCISAYACIKGLYKLA